MAVDRQVPPSAQAGLRRFWIGAALIAVLLALLLAQDLGRPMIGLHSLGYAHDAWLARSHVQYGLGYTRGFDTFALGDPPPAEPVRYLDHPVLFTLANALAMTLLGVNDASLRVANILASLVALALLLVLLRRLAGEATALLAGLFFAAVPVIAYYGVNLWLYPLAFLACLRYLDLAGVTTAREARADHRSRDATAAGPRRRRLLELAAALFLAIQMSWEGFFFAAAIGLHYLGLCRQRGSRPERGLLAVLLLSPLASVAVNLAILAAGHGWDFVRLVELARLRMTSGEFRGLGWGGWFMRLGEHALTNFTLPLLALAVLYLLARLAGRWLERGGEPDAGGRPRPASALRRALSRVPPFPCFWLFALPPLLQAFLLRGMLPAHAWWERPFAPLLAIAAALAVRGVHALCQPLGRRAAIAAAGLLVAGLLAGCLYGTSYYYGIRWQRPEMVEMFTRLRAMVPPDRALLSFEDYVFDQFPGVKARSMRPEFAWYLDREIRRSRDLEEIDRLARSGEAAYYLIPAAHPRLEVARELARLVPPLRARYRTVFSYPEQPAEKRHLPWLPREPRTLRPYREGMLPHLLFDLRERIDRP